MNSPNSDQHEFSWVRATDDERRFGTVASPLCSVKGAVVFVGIQRTIAAYCVGLVDGTPPFIRGSSVDRE
jgi:hypothetical protein